MTRRQATARAATREYTKTPRKTARRAPGSTAPDRAAAKRIAELEAQLVETQKAADEAVKTIDEAIRERDELAQRCDEMTAAGDPLAIRAEYERVIKERDDIEARRALTVEALRKSNATASRLGQERRDEAEAARAQITTLTYQRDCALDDLKAAQATILVMATTAAALEAQLRAVQRERPNAAYGPTFAGPLALGSVITGGSR